MKKQLAVLAAALATIVAVSIAPAASGEPGPNCADFTGGGFVYDAGVVSGSGQLAAPMCAQFVYTLYVLNAPGGTLLASSSTPEALPNGNPRWMIPVTDSDSDGVVCVYGTIAAKGGHVFDRAPNTGCIEVSASSGGNRDFN